MHTFFLACLYKWNDKLVTKLFTHLALSIFWTYNVTSYLIKIRYCYRQRKYCDDHYDLMSLLACLSENRMNICIFSHFKHKNFQTFQKAFKIELHFNIQQQRNIWQKSSVGKVFTEAEKYEKFILVCLLTMLSPAEDELTKQRLTNYHLLWTYVVRLNSFSPPYIFT